MKIPASNFFIFIHLVAFFNLLCKCTGFPFLPVWKVYSSFIHDTITEVLIFLTNLDGNISGDFLVPVTTNKKVAWCKMSDRLNEHQLYFPHFLSNGAINTALIQINQAKHLINILWSFSLKCPFSLHSFLACYHWKPRTNLELLWYFLTSIWNRLGLRPWLKLKQIINIKTITKCAAVM